MPTFVTHVPVDLDELLEDGAVATYAFGSESRRIMKVTVNVAVVFVVGILGTEQGWADGTRKMFHVIFPVC